MTFVSSWPSVVDFTGVLQKQLSAASLNLEHLNLPQGWLDEGSNPIPYLWWQWHSDTRTCYQTMIRMTMASWVRFWVERQVQLSCELKLVVYGASAKVAVTYKFVVVTLQLFVLCSTADNHLTVAVLHSCCHSFLRLGAWITWIELLPSILILHLTVIKKILQKHTLTVTVCST